MRTLAMLCLLVGAVATLPGCCHKKHRHNACVENQGDWDDDDGFSFDNDDDDDDRGRGGECCDGGFGGQAFGGYPQMMPQGDCGCGGGYDMTPTYGGAMYAPQAAPGGCSSCGGGGAVMPQTTYSPVTMQPPVMDAQLQPMPDQYYHPRPTPTPAAPIVAPAQPAPASTSPGIPAVPTAF